MAGIKRRAQLPPEVRAVFARVSKADWAELYVDLYRQAFGDDVAGEEVAADVNKRLAILKAYRGQA